MPAVANAVVIIAVVAYVLVRQFQARQLSNNTRRLLLVPAVLAFLALRDPHLLDPKHQALSVAFLIVGVVLEIGLGAVWGFTTRIWQGEDGRIWSKGTRASFFAWIGMMIVRIALYAAAASFGIAQGQSGLLLALAALLLVRGAVVTWRAREFAPAYGSPARAL
ncbi:CcdC protein domain-containing protein [Streptacidiphilus rugosus]|uniref:CcdC protein domain-containing protein n=1 Tax=Streptacidiphilus rugosus TaxID=405783 RepID=UPI00056C088D|nr:CcdC protein domain-containing protein [Streptacidiphilus rugosus]